MNRETVEIINDLAENQLEILFDEFLSAMLTIDDDIDDNNQVSLQIKNVEELISKGRTAGDTFATNDEKKELFKIPKSKYKDEMLDVMNRLTIKQKEYLYLAVYFMYSYNKLIALHVLNVRAYGTKYDLPVNNYIDSIFVKINNTVGETSRNKLLVELESVLDKTNSILVLILSLYSKLDKEDVYNSDFQIDLNDLIVVKNNLRYLFWEGFSLIHIISLEYDLTLGVDRNLVISFDNDLLIDLLLEGEEVWKADILEASDFDYKFYDFNSEINESFKKSLDNELKQQLNFNVLDVNKAMNFLLKQLNDTEKVHVFFEAEWICKINESGVEPASAEALFDFFSFKPKIDNSIELYDLVMKLEEFMGRSIFIPISGGGYFSNLTLIKYGHNYFRQDVYSSPAKYIRKNRVVSKISNAFCEIVVNELKGAFKNSIVIQNLHLSSICNVNREIDVLFIHKNQIYIFECKRLAFSINDRIIRNQKKELEGTYKKQLVNEINGFKKNKEKILKHLNNDYPEIAINKEYLINGYIVTKEYTLAHSLSENNHLLHINNLVSYLKEFDSVLSEE